MKHKNLIIGVLISTVIITGVSMGLFDKIKKAISPEDAKANTPADVYGGLRQQILALHPSEIGLDSSSGKNVWAVLMETGYDDVVVTLVAIADGTVSLYFSNGGGMIGLGENEEVKNASDDLIGSAENYLEHAELTDSFPLPRRGNARFYFLTFDGIYTVEVKENDLGNNKLPLSPFFHKAHEVIGQARIADEKRRMEAQQIISASARGDVEEIKKLLHSGISVNSIDDTFLSPLMSAAHSGQIESMTVLLDASAEIENKDKEGYTALMFASNAGKTACVELLIEKGADVNAKAHDGSTPIMFAAQHGHNDVVKVLLENGADPRVEGSHGLSAIGFAVQNNHKEIERILKEGRQIF